MIVIATLTLMEINVFRVHTVIGSCEHSASGYNAMQYLRFLIVLQHSDVFNLGTRLSLAKTNQFSKCEKQIIYLI